MTMTSIFFTYLAITFAIGLYIGIRRIEDDISEAFTYFLIFFSIGFLGIIVGMMIDDALDAFKKEK